MRAKAAPEVSWLYGFAADKLARGKKNGEASHPGEDCGLGPEFGQASSAQDNAADDLDVVGSRDETADALEEDGHVLDEEDIAAEKHRGEYGPHGELEGFGLGARLGGDDESEAEHGEQEWQREREKSKHAAVNGDKEHDAHDEEDGAEFDEGEDTVGDHLADHEAEGGDGRHGELLEGAALAFADETERNKKDGHDLEKDGDEAGHEEVSGARGRIVEDGRANFDGDAAAGY